MVHEVGHGHWAGVRVGVSNVTHFEGTVETYLAGIPLSVAMAQPRFFQKMDTVFQIKLPLF